MSEIHDLKKLQFLKRELTRHDYRYYILNDPIISDQDYDKMYKEYEAALMNLIGRDTRSIEFAHCYPDWVLEEFKGVEPKT